MPVIEITKTENDISVSETAQSITISETVRNVQMMLNGAISDHGGLTGLADDDHPQYFNQTRGDARYYTQGQVDSAITTAINNLIDTAPAALDTLDELAAALGDDANFAATMTTSLAGKVAKAGDTMTGALEFADQADALKSGAYTLQMKSGVADGASATGFLFDTANALSTSGAAVARFASGGDDFLTVQHGIGAGPFGSNAAVISSASASPTFGSIILNTAILGSILFQSTGGGGTLGVFPATNAFATTQFGTNADPASVAFAFSAGAQYFANFYKDNTNFSLKPYSAGSAITLGQAGYEWNGLYLQDSAPIYLGDAQDATIQYDGSNLVIDPDVVGSGYVQIAGDLVLPNNNGTTNLGIGTTNPTAGLEIRGNFGGSYVPNFSAAMVLAVTDWNSWNLVYGNAVVPEANWIANYMSNNGHLYFGDATNYGILQIKTTTGGTIDSAVGINTTDNAAQLAKRDLDVYCRAQNDYAIVNVTGRRQFVGSGQQTGLINFNIDANSDFDVAKIEAWTDLTGGNGGYLIFKTGAAGNVEALRLTRAGATQIAGDLDHDGSSVGLYNVAPVARATTSGAAAAFVANTSGIADDSATFDGYTIGQVVTALRNIGILT